MIEGIRWIDEPSGKKALYVKQDGDFVRYNASSIARPDHKIPGASMGFATAQFAIKAGYKYI
ncbi:MAG: hypothetical protein ACKPFF_28320 [Planktothrix sp.]